MRRHIGPGEEQIEEMLAALRLASLDDLVDKAFPHSIIDDDPLELPPVKSERATLSYLREMSERNRVFISMIGMGYYGTVMPKVILRNVMENPGWYTAYTPYQAEVSQGRLEVLLNFQQMVMDLTGMELANASLLDEATAAAGGHGHGAPRGQEQVAQLLRLQGLPPADHRRGPDPGALLGPGGRRRRPFHAGLSGHEVFGVLAAVSGLLGRTCTIYRALVRTGARSGRLGRRWPATCWRFAC